ncbi:MAG: hypothetical protein IJ318_02035 [Clostridia bacterium]|nr:hypothetical protein [Clostridia bacterium]
MKQTKVQELVNEVTEDFKKRSLERKPFDAQWQLNMNFLMGNQYCSVGYNNDIEEYDKQFFWQEREVFNHIASIVESRLAKLKTVRPTMTVIPTSGDESDVKTAKLAKKIINSIYNKEDMSKLICEATKWSEITGSAFYKITWNNSKGQTFAVSDDGKKIKMGDIQITVCSPFEIYPESTSSADINDCKSIIHARAYSVDDIEAIWGKKVAGEEVNIFSLDSKNDGIGGLDYNARATKIVNTVKSNYAVVIERYEKPTLAFPNGRLVIVAGGELLFDGELPYLNGNDEARCFPFVRQVCLEQSGCFWGSSVIERIIPIQRAYNAVKNRKHEYMNRLSMGVLTVEDGSVDIDNLEEEGLSPGKILVYRQGANAPSYMSNTYVPSEFSIEEERLLNEFKTISGVTDIVNSNLANANISGVALQLLIEQDEARLTITSDQIKQSIKEVARQILRLYKQFATVPRLLKIKGDHGELELEYFCSSDITSDEVTFETDTELNESLAQRRSMVFELLNAGLLHNEDGKLTNRMRIKALELLGFGVWEHSQDLFELHQKKASCENNKFMHNETVEISEIDDHEIHINEHIAFMLGGDFEKNATKTINKNMLEHIREHKKFKKITTENMQ